MSREADAWAPEYRDLAGRIRSRFGSALAGTRRIPFILEIHPGLACPASCTFCPTQGVKLYAPERRRAPLRAEELRILVKDFAALGGELLVLSGGLEPLSGPAIPTAAAATEAGLEVHLYTSGLSPVLDDPSERRALLHSAQRIRLSVNGASEGVYGEVQQSGRPGASALARVQRRLAALASDRDASGSHASLGMSFVLVEANIRDLTPAVEHAERLGFAFFDALVDIDRDAPVAPDLARALEDLRRRAADRLPGGLRIRVSGRTGTAPARVPRCVAPRVKVAVDPFGFAWRCCYAANPEVASPELLLGDVRVQGLRVVLESAAKSRVETGCATCPDFERTFNALAES